MITLDRRHFLGASFAFAGLLASPSRLTVPRESSLPAGIPDVAPPISGPPILRQALAALDRHADRIIHRDRLGVVDFSVHSGEPRFHIVDIGERKVLHSLLVAHGRGSDPANSGYATRFSNRPGSNASSSGSYVTGDAYVGKHGRSRRLHGLEEGNDLAFERAIVIHGASYVDRSMAEVQGRVGRSLGCFAFEQSEIGTVLELLGAGRLLYAAA